MVDFLASRIKMADAPPRATWWARHASCTARFLAIYGRRSEANLEAIRATLDAQSKEWDALIPKTCDAGLMAKHVRLETALVESARAGFSDYIERIGDLLVSLADTQSRDLAAHVPGLPVRQLKYLLLGHSGLFISRVKHAIAREDGRKCHAEAEQTDLALAAFTMEWF